MKLRCPACGTVHDVATNLAHGQRVECTCGHKFVVSAASIVDDDEGAVSSSSGARVRSEEDLAPPSGGAACPSCGALLAVPVGDLTPGAEIVCPACGSICEVAESSVSTRLRNVAGEGAEEAPDERVEGRPSGDAAGDILRAGTRIGRCRIEKCIGVGGMGAVYRAHHETLDIPVAVKVMLPRYSDRADFKERFYREARTAARLNHPNVVRVLDCGEENDLLFLVMEYVDGGNLREVLEKRGRLSPQEVIDVGVAVCHALTEAARHRIIHRDIKPENIMYTRDGVYKLADLGLAKQISDAPDDAGLTMAAVTMGTPFYMAPEQAVDARKCDARSDIYALGATLYHLLCGRPPFTGKSAFEVMQQHVSGTCPPPSSLNPQTPPGLERIIARAMMKKPEERYQSAEEMLRDLEALAAGRADASAAAVPGALPPPLPSSVRKARPKRKTRWIAAAAGFLVLLFVIAAVRKAARHARKRSAAAVSASAVSPGTTGKPGTPVSAPFRFRKVRVSELHAPGRKPEWTLEVEVEPSDTKADFTTGSVRVAGLNHPLQRTADGAFTVVAGPIPPLDAGQSVSVALRKSDGDVVRRVFRIPPHPRDWPVIVPKKPAPLPPRDGTLQESGTVTVQWKKIPNGSGWTYHVEIGRVLLTGEWQPLFSREAGRDVEQVEISRQALLLRLFGAVRKGALQIRIIAWKDLSADGLDVPLRWTIISQNPLPRPGRGGAWGKMPAGLSDWEAALNPDDREKSRAACERMLREKGTAVLPFLWRSVLNSDPTRAWWAAYTLAALAKRSDAVAAFSEAFPGAMERKYALRKLVERWKSPQRIFPPEFGDLLRDLDEGRSSGAAGGLRRGAFRFRRPAPPRLLRDDRKQP